MGSRRSVVVLLDRERRARLPNVPPKRFGPETVLANWLWSTVAKSEPTGGPVTIAASDRATLRRSGSGWMLDAALPRVPWGRQSKAVLLEASADGLRYLVCAPLSGATVTAYDPVAMNEARHRHFGERIRYAEVPMGALEGADGLVVVTEWNEFRRPDFEAVKAALRTPVVFDGRNVYPRATLEKLGFTYYGIGC